LATSFVSFHARYARFFVTRTRSVAAQALHYLTGLAQAVRKNIERMTEVVVDSEYQSLHHFISHSPWEYRPVMDQVALDADQLLGGVDAGLCIDETSNPKKGDKSVATARQWCGNLGKVENCQVAVFSSLVNGSSAALIDCRLYIPEEWASDQSRCNKAGIPRDSVFKSKTELALDSIRHLRSLGVRFSWIGVDGGYGKEPAFLCALDDLGELFVADVHKDQRIYLDDPTPYLPAKKPGKGRTPSRYKTEVASIEVQAWAAAQAKDAWQRITTRNTTKGKLMVDVLVQQVWCWNKAETKARRWKLIVRREINSPGTIKYSLTNSAEDVTVDRMAFMQGQRFFVERAFQDAKGSAGLDHYQVRSWQAWNHHMALVMMSMLFMLETRIEHKERYPLLSCPDVSKLLTTFLPRRDADINEVQKQMELRHNPTTQFNILLI